MKVIILNKRIIKTVLITLLVLFAAANTVFSPAILTFKNNMEIKSIKKQIYKEYNAMNNKFSFKLPKDWTTWQQTFDGGEIIYNLFFKSPDAKIHGFVQVWNVDKPLKQFVEESKQSSVGAVSFKYFDVKQIMVDRKVGYLLDYSRPNEQDVYYKGYEALIDGDDGNIYRVSFFVEEKNWKQFYSMIFNTIIQSFDIK